MCHQEDSSHFAGLPWVSSIMLMTSPLLLAQFSLVLLSIHENVAEMNKKLKK